MLFRGEGSTNDRILGIGTHFAFFYGSILRSGKILLQNCAILYNALQTKLLGLPMIRNAMQHSENVRNSLGLNYKSAALTN